MAATNPVTLIERTSREYVILALSAATVLGVLPFAVHRVLNSEWLIAALDFGLVAAMIAMFTYVYTYRKTEAASMILAVAFLFGSIATIALKGAPQIYWSFPATVGVYFLLSIPKAIAVNSVGILIIFGLVHSRLAGTECGAYIVSLVAANVFIVIFAIRNHKQKQQLEALTLKDPLTGVFNRRSFELFLSEFDDKRAKQEQSICLVVLDIDYFKSINDSHGHLVGDEVLIRLVTLMRTQLHHDERIFRIGGEEYALAPMLLPLSDTFEFAERLRKVIEHSNINESLGITVSLGISQYESGETGKQWFSRADAALYEAKKKGRNRTESAPQTKED